jgi:hypothetical protein
MIPGDLVIIVGKLDTRIRDKDQEQLVYGTVDQLLIDGQVSVILENNDIWVGHRRDLILPEEQQ